MTKGAEIKPSALVVLVPGALGWNVGPSLLMHGYLLSFRINTQANKVTLEASAGGAPRAYRVLLLQNAGDCLLKRATDPVMWNH